MLIAPISEGEYLATMYRTGELQPWDQDDTDWYNRHYPHNPIGGLDQYATSPRQHRPRARRPRQRGQATRSSSASGDSNDGSDPESERPRNPEDLLDQQAFADQLCISKHTLQNLYSKTPWLLPPAISIPGARGPRWMPAAVQEWLEQRPRHTSAPVPVAPKKRVGRPRIAASRSAGGAS